MMGRAWDKPDGIAFRPEVWRLCHELLAPGGHLVAFGHTRRYHRLGRAIEDAGFEIRDTLSWIYATGFPHSYNLGNGSGTGLKPAHELICLARKPLVGTVAANVLKYSTGVLNIDACRIECTDKTPFPEGITSSRGEMLRSFPVTPRGGDNHSTARWPANIITDGSDEVVELFPLSKGQQGDVRGDEPSHIGDSGIYGHYNKTGVMFRKRDEPISSAARFYYCAKASKAERNGSKHPTIKPVNLMRWLVRLVTPPGGIVLDPFAGTGTTGEAALLEGMGSILIERESEYVRDIELRLSRAGLKMRPIKERSSL